MLEIFPITDFTLIEESKRTKNWPHRGLRWCLMQMLPVFILVLFTFG